MDRLLEGGLSIKTLLEICGPAGSGKTQLVQSIAVNVAKEGAKVDFIHTKYDFSAHRCNVLGGGNLNDTVNSLHYSFKFSEALTEKRVACKRFVLFCYPYWRRGGGRAIPDISG